MEKQRVTEGGLYYFLKRIAELAREGYEVSDKNDEFPMHINSIFECVMVKPNSNKKEETPQKAPEPVQDADQGVDKGEEPNVAEKASQELTDASEGVVVDANVAAEVEDTDTAPKQSTPKKRGRKPKEQ